MWENIKEKFEPDISGSSPLVKRLKIIWVCLVLTLVVYGMYLTAKLSGG